MCKLILWNLDRLDSVNCDEMRSILVRAETETEARSFASKACGDEGPHPWLDRKLVSCCDTEDDDLPGVVMCDYNAG